MARIGGQIARIALLAALMMSALMVLYKVGPNRDSLRLEWVSWGAVTATVLWVIGSAGFSAFVNDFGSYSRTYGALAGVIVLTLWLLVTMFVILLGGGSARVGIRSRRRELEAPMRFLRMLLGALAWILAAVIGLLAVILCLTIVLLPIGLPLLFLARRLFGVASKLVLPRAVTDPTRELGRSIKRRGRRTRKKMKKNAGGRRIKKARKKAEKSAGGRRIKRMLGR